MSEVDSVEIMMRQVLTLSTVLQGEGKLFLNLVRKLLYIWISYLALRLCYGFKIGIFLLQQYPGLQTSHLHQYGTILREQDIVLTQTCTLRKFQFVNKGGMRWMSDGGPKDAYCYCELPLTCKNQIYLNVMVNLLSTNWYNFYGPGN